MHIPDGFLDPLVAGTTYIIFIVFAIITTTKVRNIKDEELINISIVAAAIFVAQMLNWPIPGGTSAHFVGGSLAGILFGIWIGFIIMTIVLVIQALVFRDGGITTLGANVLNMGIIAVVVGYIVFKAITRKEKNRNTVFLGGFAGGLLGAFLAGTACGLEIGLSTHFPFGIIEGVIVMGSWHFVLGIIEGIITGLVLVYLYERGELLANQ